MWTTSALLHLLPADATGGWIAATLNGRMLLFTLAPSVLTGLLFGLAPALQASRSRVASTLRSNKRVWRRPAAARASAASWWWRNWRYRCCC